MKIGIDIGGSHIAIGVVNSNGIIVEKIEKRLTQKEKTNIQKSIEEYIIKNVTEFIKKYKIELVGIAAPGTIKDGVILWGGNLNVTNYDIVEKYKIK